MLCLIKDDDDENFIWAGTFMAHEVYQKEYGTLGVRIPETVWNAFDKEEKKDDDNKVNVDVKKPQNSNFDNMQVKVTKMKSYDFTGFFYKTGIS